MLPGVSGGATNDEKAPVVPVAGIRPATTGGCAQGLLI